MTTESAPRATAAGRKRLALAAAAGMLAFGAVWVGLSDAVLSLVVDDVRLLGRIEVIKDLAFALLATLFVYVALRDAAVEVGPDEAPVPASAGPGAGRPSSVRRELAWLALAILLPMFVLVGYNLYREAQGDRRDAARSAELLARILAAETARFLRDNVGLAEGLARLPQVRGRDPAACTGPLGDVVRTNANLANARVFGPGGTPLCAVTPATPTAAPAWLQQAVASGRAIGGPEIEPGSGRTVVWIAVPARDAAGAPVALVALALDLERFAPGLAASPPQDGITGIVDGEGRILARIPRVQHLGSDGRGEPGIEAALARRSGNTSVRGADGIDRFVGFTPIEGSAWIAWAGIPTGAALGDTRASFLRSGAALATLFLCALVFAFFAARRIERPLSGIARTARAVAAGDRSARAPLSGLRETRDVATQMNALLDRLPELERQVQQSEARLATVLHAAREGIVIYGADDVITFANDAFQRHMEWQAAESGPVVGRRINDVTRPEFQSHTATRNVARRQGVREEYETAVTDRDGLSRWLRVSATPLFTLQGAYDGVLAVTADVTDRKDAEARSDQMSRFYRALGKTSEAIVRLSDRRALFDAVCRIAVDECGFVSAFVGVGEENGTWMRPGGHAGRTFGIIGAERTSFAPGSPHHDAPMATAFRTGQVQIVNDFLGAAATRPALPEAMALGIRASCVLPLACDGRVVAALGVYAPTKDFFHADLVELLRRIADDVSLALEHYERAAARDRAEAEVRALNAALEDRVAERTRRLTEANQQLESFTYSVSHDLRAPLRAVNGYAHLLEHSSAAILDDEGRRLLANVIAASARMGRLIDDLLEFARLGRGELELHAVAIAPVLGPIVESLRGAIDAAGARVEIADDFPRVVSAETLLHQVFLNLLSNALQYRRDDVLPEIAVDWAREGDRVLVCVRDNGVGVAPEDHQKMFEVFRRLHTQKTPGTGIGLAIVAKAVGLMEGSIHVESTLGAGCAFWISLKAADPGPERPRRDAMNNSGVMV